jgi:hypothetical protein
MEELKVAVEPIESTEKDATVAEPIATESVEATEGETSTAPAEESTATKIDEAVKSAEEQPADVNEVEDIFSEEPKKDGVQKRIDKLTAEKKALAEENARLKAEKGEQPKTEPQYTEEQLKRAFNKAIAEGDAELAWEIQQYQFKNLEKNLTNKYLEEQKRVTETQQRVTQEWNNVVQQYDYLANEPMYQGSTKELNLKDANSLLYQVALKLFNDPELNNVYRVPGGQKLAVADALQLILRKKKDKIGKSSENDLLKRKLAKEKRKSTLGSGEALRDDAPAPKRYSSEKEKLDDYVNERKKFVAERIGF